MVNCSWFMVIAWFYSVILINHPYLEASHQRIMVLLGWFGRSCAGDECSEAADTWQRKSRCWFVTGMAGGWPWRNRLLNISGSQQPGGGLPSMGQGQHAPYWIHGSARRRQGSQLHAESIHLHWSLVLDHSQWLLFKGIKSDFDVATWLVEGEYG